MKLHDMIIFDNVLTTAELSKWQERCKASDEQSTPCSAEEMKNEIILEYARKIVGNLELIHAPRFAIKEGMHTEMHRDIGEYAVCFYPFDCPTAPLSTEIGNFEVKANRMIAFDATKIEHRQMHPTDGSTRYSIAMKFRHDIELEREE